MTAKEHCRRHLLAFIPFEQIRFCLCHGFSIFVAAVSFFERSMSIISSNTNCFISQAMNVALAQSRPGFSGFCEGIVGGAPERVNAFSSLVSNSLLIWQFGNHFMQAIAFVSLLGLIGSNHSIAAVRYCHGLLLLTSIGSFGTVCGLWCH